MAEDPDAEPPTYEQLFPGLSLKDKPNSLPPGAWNPMPLNTEDPLGSFSFNQPQLFNFSLPDDVPKDTREILLFVFLDIGWSKPSRCSFIKVFTKVDGTHHSHYIAMHTYEQNSFSTNSDNVWLPMGSDRKVYVDVPHKFECGTEGSVYLIGHR